MPDPIFKSREEIEKEVSASLAEGQSLSEEEFIKRVDDELAKQGSTPTVTESIPEALKLFTVFVNVKKYLKIEATDKEEAFDKLKLLELGECLELRNVRWDKEEIL